MARLDELTALTATTSTDLLLVEDDVGGTNAHKKMAISNFFGGIPVVVVMDAGADTQEETSDPSNPASGYRRIFARDSGGLGTLDSDGNRHEIEFAGGRVLGIDIEPTPASWQHKAAATSSQYGAMRIEWGNDTLSAGTKAITFQQTFKTILEVFVQDKTGANTMYPSGLGTSGFTANGTGSDTFAWLALGVD